MKENPTPHADFKSYISRLLDGSLIVPVGSRKVRRPYPRLEELHKRLKLPGVFEKDTVLTPAELADFTRALEQKDEAQGTSYLKSSLELYEAWQQPLQKELEAHQTLLRRYFLNRFTMSNLNIYFALMGPLEDLLGVEPQLQPYLKAVGELHSHQELNATLSTGDETKRLELMAMLTSLEATYMLGELFS